MKARFNSLQTGKPIQSFAFRTAPFTTYLVSIPFKRENLSKAKVAVHKGEYIKFQFPSNGKTYPKFVTITCETGDLGYVSIPFKRENLSKGTDRQSVWQGVNRFWFQFPSNGKTYPKLTPPSREQSIALSFNSLQTGKPIQRDGEYSVSGNEITCFNSLQTGKPIQRTYKMTEKMLGKDDLFQFPSNGKTYPKAK